jgi:hypothetical protein
MTSSCRSYHYAARTWSRWPSGPSNQAYLSSPHLKASTATTFRACSSPATTLVKPQSAPTILSKQLVHTTLSITHHTRKWPSTGPRTTHGPQSPPRWVHWQHTHIVTWEKRKRKETNKKKLQEAIESQTKAKRKVTWRRQVSDPLGKGNGSTHPRQNYAQAKSTNHQTKARKITKSSPCTHASSPWTMQFPLDECMPTTRQKQSSCTNSALTGQTYAQMWTGPTLWPVRPVTTTGQTGDTQSPEMARDHLKTFKMHSVAQNMLKLPTPLLTMHESSKKCKKCNLELLRQNST